MPAADPVDAERRFRSGHPCPVCGGAADDPRGSMVRCWGFISADGRLACCTREEHAGALTLNGDGTTYAHLLIGDCACGQTHDAELRANRARMAGRVPDRDTFREAGARPDARSDDGDDTGEPRARHLTRFDLRDVNGEMVAIHWRLDRDDGTKDRMWWTQPDGTPELDRPVTSLPLFGAHRLADVPVTETVILTEGEKKSLCLTGRGFHAVGTVTGAKTVPDDDVLRPLLRYPVVLWPDNDDAGREHMQGIAERLRFLGHRNVRRLTWPEAPPKGDAADFFASTPEDDDNADARRIAACRAMIEAALPVSDRTVWDDAESAVDFVNSLEADVEWFEENLIARGVITELFAPRGVGKTHVLHAELVKLARRGLRCLLLDRDNSRSTVRGRLRQWCAGDPPPTLKIMTRETVRPLTDKRAWATFPFRDYDVVAIDSLDASAEGVGEKDSSKPSAAFAPLLDVVHRKDGPAIIILGNTIKSGSHSRGSGVIEDRGDISFEVRDATGLVPSGKRPWWLELPDAGVEAWAERANRRKRRTVYRLAFVASKFRVAEEPDPWLVELRLPKDAPWTMADVTHAVVEQGETVRQDTLVEQRRKLDRAARMLYHEIRDRERRGAAPMARERDAVPWLMEHADLSRAQARDVLDEVRQPRRVDAVLECAPRWYERKGKGRGGALVLWTFPDLLDVTQFIDTVTTEVTL